MEVTNQIIDLNLNKWQAVLARQLNYKMNNLRK